MNTTKKYEIGEDSRLFLQVLDTFQSFENDFLDTLKTVYGENEGEQFYLSHVEQLEDVERIIMDYLRVLFTQEMGTNAERVTI